MLVVYSAVWCLGVIRNVWYCSRALWPPHTMWSYMTAATWGQTMCSGSHTNYAICTTIGQVPSECLLLARWVLVLSYCCHLERNPTFWWVKIHTIIDLKTYQIYFKYALNFRQQSLCWDSIDHADGQETPWWRFTIVFTRTEDSICCNMLQTCSWGERLLTFRAGTLHTLSCLLFQYAHKLAHLVGQSVHSVPSERLSDRLYFL